MSGAVHHLDSPNPVCVLANVGSVPILIGILCVIALASSFDYPSEQAIIARVVPTKQLGYASGLGETRESAANLIGSPLDGSDSPPLL